MARVALTKDWPGLWRRSLKLRLLTLALVPAMMLPLLALVVVLWGGAYFDRMLIYKARTDLYVARTQLQHMQALASEAQQLQAQPRTSPQDAARALQASVTATLGAGAKLALSGDRATLTLQGVQADALANWLAQARNNARAVPQEAHLTRSANPRQGNGAPTPTVRWDGTLVLSLPTR